jgi:hypothetical protein
MYHLQTEDEILPKGYCWGCLLGILIKKTPTKALESIHDYHKEKGRERVPLAKALSTFEEAMQATVDQDRKAGRGNTSKNPLPPFRTKPTTPQYIREDILVDMVQV